MPKQDNQEKFINLRNNFGYFVYEAYHIRETGDQVEISFDFDLAGRYRFRPALAIPKKSFFCEHVSSPAITDDAVNNMVFHIGMIELISYWKAACPPLVIIKPHSLLPAQMEWWKNLYFNGLGEFFHLNSIETDFEDFMTISALGESSCRAFEFQGKEAYLVPVGGGKDSAVSLEILKTAGPCFPFMINPRPAMTGTAAQAGYNANDCLVFWRSIDPLLLELNEKGFLNGHTPFSALLAFAGLLGAYLAGVKNIALSNEASANEATVPGTSINHQYSKTIDFESDFREYTREYITPGINYFSFLRPLSELQIARLFSTMPRYLETFRSCNVGSKTDSWCGHCSKCLFTYIILSPFIREDVLTGIFGSNLLDKADLEIPFLELTGYLPEKPFECIGTIHEVRAAMLHLIQNYHGPRLPRLADLFLHHDLENGIDPASPLPGHLQINHEHFLTPGVLSLLLNRLNVS